MAENPADLPKYTWTNNLVAVISDGSAILGLGNLGPKAAIPVMGRKSATIQAFCQCRRRANRLRRPRARRNHRHSHKP
ncbi:hypothetical protein [Candidatus Minimicrobia naudis]